MHGRALFALNAVIEGLYASAADGSPWDVNTVHSLLGTDFCHILYMDETGMIIGGSSSGVPESIRQEYMADWAPIDEVHPIMFARTPGRAITDEALSQPEREATPVFEGFYEPNGLVYPGVGHQPLGNGLYCGVSVQNSRSIGPIRTETLQCINLINQHLRRAMQINDFVTALQARAQLAESLLFQWGLGLVHCDSLGRIHRTQGTAETLMTRFRSVIRSTAGSLQLVDAGSNRRLHRLLHDPGDGAPYAGPTFALRDPATGAALELTVLPYEPARELINAADRLVLLREADSPGKVDRHYLRRRFAITPAEADVLAQLMLGASVEAIAEARGSTLETIRSYLKALRRKLGVESQAQLVSTGWQAISLLPGAAARNGRS